MNIKLEFEYHSCVVFIPDGFIISLDDMQMTFLEWVSEQLDCIIKDADNLLALSYDENDFIKYANDVLLKDSKEKAYQVKNAERASIHRVLRF